MKEVDKMHRGGGDEWMRCIKDMEDMEHLEKIDEVEEKIRSIWRKWMVETEVFEPWTYSSTAMLFTSR